MYHFNLCSFVVELSYITVSQNIVQPIDTSDDGLERLLSLHPPLKLGAYFKPVIFEQKRKIRLSGSTYKVTGYVNVIPTQTFQNVLLLSAIIQDYYEKTLYM